MDTKKISPSISNRRVFVGLSGGVDSAVSAALLKEEGYDVTGVFIRGWQPDWLTCTWREERRDAMRVCLRLEIPFLFFDMEKEYKEAVVDKMLTEYKRGRTPNPDVLCNREIKFGLFWQRAREMGADYIATGHYLSGLKDQSYFLWTLTQEDLAHTMFPVGQMEKVEVRELAKKFKLPVAEKKDSQGICFLGAVSMENFLSHYIDTKSGKVLNVDGEEIGRHRGLVYYTMGERHGFEVSKKSESSGPFYVVAKDEEKNVLVVSDRESEIVGLSPKKVRVKDVNWTIEPRAEKVSASIRYRGEKLPARVVGDEVEFERPVRGLSLGQSVVFYSREDGQMLGGAVMDEVIS